MFITGRDTPEEAYEEIYTLNDGPPVSSRKAVLNLFDESLVRIWSPLRALDPFGYNATVTALADLAGAACFSGPRPRHRRCAPGTRGRES